MRIHGARRSREVHDSIHIHMRVRMRNVKIRHNRCGLMEGSMKGCVNTRYEEVEVVVVEGLHGKGRKEQSAVQQGRTGGSRASRRLPNSSGVYARACDLIFSSLLYTVSFCTVTNYVDGVHTRLESRSMRGPDSPIRGMRPTGLMPDADTTQYIAQRHTSPL